MELTIPRRPCLLQYGRWQAPDETGVRRVNAAGKQLVGEIGFEPTWVSPRHFKSIPHPREHKPPPMHALFILGFLVLRGAVPRAIVGSLRWVLRTNYAWPVS